MIKLHQKYLADVDDMYIGPDECDILSRAKRDKIIPRRELYNQYTEVVTGLAWASDGSSVNEWSLSKLEDLGYVIYKNDSVILTDKGKDLSRFMGL